MTKSILLSLLALLASLPVRADDLGADMAYANGDYATAFREWSAAAAAGDASAMSAMGTLYDTGNGVPQNFATALAWYIRAAEAGSVRAMFNVGAMFDNGRGTPVDRREAVRWYTRAANQGHGRAAFALGLIYRSGDGVPRDRAAAVRFFRIALAAGIEAARTNLASLGSPAPKQPASVAVAMPKPVPRPRPSAPGREVQIANVQKTVLSRATLDSDARGAFAALVPGLTEQAGKDGRLAQYNVGYAFEHGYGVKPDPVRSYVYYLRAATSTDPSIKDAAMRGASDVGKALDEAQHVEARDMLLDGKR